MLAVTSLYELSKSDYISLLSMIVKKYMINCWFRERRINFEPELKSILVY